jgi:23S rRNA (uracil1939-C5)-methyltransferase
MPFELSPQKLVYGGAALGHYQGRAVLVPRALPGERVEVETVRTAKGVVHARLLRVLDAAPERVDPPCPYFGRCGGCQLQQLSAGHQTISKQDVLRETLRRIGKILWDADIPLFSAHPWNYRSHAQLKVACQADGQVALGFFEAESHRLISVEACLILSPRLNSILVELRRPEWSALLADCREIELAADDEDEKVMITLHGSLTAEKAEKLARQSLAQLPGAVCVAFPRGRDWQVFGEPALVYRVGEFQYKISPGSFFQASRFLIPKLVHAVTKDPLDRQAPGSQGATSGGGNIALDLYAGVGLFTLPLARSFSEVVGVEGNATSSQDLARNAEIHGLKNLRAAPATAFDFLRRYAQLEPDLVVLDPPRTGVDLPTLRLLTALRPRRIHYVSCAPPTLARDLRFLVQQGFRLNSIELFDLFPQTYHIESLARLTR